MWKIGAFWGALSICTALNALSPTPGTSARVRRGERDEGGELTRLTHSPVRVLMRAHDTRKLESRMLATVSITNCHCIFNIAWSWLARRNFLISNKGHGLGTVATPSFPMSSRKAKPTATFLASAMPAASPDLPQWISRPGDAAELGSRLITIPGATATSLPQELLERLQGALNKIKGLRQATAAKRARTQLPANAGTVALTVRGVDLSLPLAVVLVTFLDERSKCRASEACRDLQVVVASPFA